MNSEPLRNPELKKYFIHEEQSSQTVKEMNRAQEIQGIQETRNARVPRNGNNERNLSRKNFSPEFKYLI